MTDSFQPNFNLNGQKGEENRRHAFPHASVPAAPTKAVKALVGPVRPTVSAPKEFLKIEEAAKRLRVSKRQFERWRDDETLEMPVIRPKGYGEKGVSRMQMYEWGALARWFERVFSA